VVVFVVLIVVVLCFCRTLLVYWWHLFPFITLVEFLLLFREYIFSDRKIERGMASGIPPQNLIFHANLVILLFSKSSPKFVSRKKNSLHKKF